MFKDKKKKKSKQEKYFLIVVLPFLLERGIEPFTTLIVLVYPLNIESRSIKDLSGLELALLQAEVE